MTALAEPEAADGGRPATQEASPRTRGRGPKLSTIFLLVFVGAGVKVGFERLHDNSFMWHLRTGRYILDHGIPRGDIYSFTEPGTKWIVQSWLAEVFYGAVDRVGGPLGLRVLGAVMGGLAGGLLFWIAYKASRDRMRGAMLAALAFAVLLNVWVQRPLMFGVLAMLVLVIAVEFADTWPGRHLYITLPVLMWLWVNTHGTFMLGFGYLALHLIGQWIEHKPPTAGRERDLLRASALAGVVTLLNPYFLDLVLFPVRLMGRGEVLADVSEWQAPDFRRPGALLFGVWIVVTILILVRKHAGWRDLIVSVGFLCLGLYAIRNVGLAAIVCLPIVARLVAVEGEPRPDRRTFHRVLVAAIVALIALIGVNAAAEPDWDTSGYPVLAWKDMRAVQHLQGKRILTTDGWGGYLILVSGPEQKVFFDDRYDMYSIKLNNDYSKMLRVRPGWDKTLDQYDIDVVMWPRDAPFAQAISRLPGWDQTYVDNTAVVYVRQK